MNQIIAVVMLFGITTAILAPIIAESGSQIFSKSVSIADTMDDSRYRAGQILVATGIQSQNDSDVILYLSNIGVHDIRIHVVLVDGIDVSYTLQNQDGQQQASNTIPSDSLAVLQVHKETGRDTIQIITDTGKLFEFDISVLGI